MELIINHPTYIEVEMEIRLRILADFSNGNSRQDAYCSCCAGPCDLSTDGETSWRHHAGGAQARKLILRKATRHGVAEPQIRACFSWRRSFNF